MRRIFVGDIQGCSQALDRLLKALKIRSADRLICVGDLVNRGPDSLGVLRRLAERNAEVVLGNHDIYLLEAAEGLRSLPKKSVLRPLLDAPDCAELLDWLAGQRVMLIEPDVVVVHAGLHPQWRNLKKVAGELNRAWHDPKHRFTNDRIEYLTSVRHCDGRGRRPRSDDPPPGPPFRPWDDFYRGKRTAVFGHWARRGLVDRPRRRGLDTGCVYGGALTAWICEEDRFVQVDGQRSV
ncbi:MAG TPA: metallophosphoesterase [Candidatus Acidoferrales bacterium]|nr:metallophosphoesterase [Candidatus Acidoferrales bacterium]